jgi:hypothetical protein
VRDSGWFHVEENNDADDDDEKQKYTDCDLDNLWCCGVWLVPCKLSELL